MNLSFYRSISKASEKFVWFLQSHSVWMRKPGLGYWPVDSTNLFINCLIGGQGSQYWYLLNTCSVPNTPTRLNGGQGNQYRYLLTTYAVPNTPTCWRGMKEIAYNLLREIKSTKWTTESKLCTVLYKDRVGGGSQLLLGAFPCPFFFYSIIFSTLWRPKSFHGVTGGGKSVVQSQEGIQKRQDRKVGMAGTVLVSQVIASTPFFGAEIPLGHWGGDQTAQTHVFLDTMRLVFYQQEADRKNPGKTCHNEPVDNPRMRHFFCKQIPKQH